MRDLNIETMNQNITNLMDQTNTTQAKLAEAIGMSQSNVSRALSNREGQRFTLEQVYKISQYFDVSIDVLLADEKPLIRTDRELCELFTFLIEKRQLISSKTKIEEEIYTPFLNDDLYMDCNITRESHEYNSFYFPNYENPGPLDRFTETEIDAMRDNACWNGNAHSSNQQINTFFEKYLQIYEMFLHNQISEDLFHEITEKFLNDLK